MSNMPADGTRTRIHPVTRDPQRVPLYRFSGPRYWLLWLGLGLVRTLNVLPLRSQMAVGRLLGRIAHAVSRRDRRIAHINVELCFPGLTPEERADVVKEHFESLGCALLETGLVWWASAARLRRLIEFRGVEHLQAALDKGRGALMLSAHFTTLERGRSRCSARPASCISRRRTR
jgi:KDO2-lipid IV(A) lauroyltransferase